MCSNHNWFYRKESFIMRVFVVAASFLVLSTGLLVGEASAILVAEWTFEVSAPSLSNSSTISGILSEFGAGTASGRHASSSTDWSNPVGNGSSESFNSNNWGIGDFYEFTVSTVGFESIQVSWDQTRSSTGPSDFQFQFTTDGLSYTTFDSYSVPVASWSGSSAEDPPITSFSQDLAGVLPLNDNANVSFRLVATSAGTNTLGSNRIDNFQVNAAAVPEPTAFLFGGLVCGLVSLSKLRRTKPADVA